MKKQVFIIHGWEGKPDSNWFPWLKKELECKDFDVFMPQMPNPDYPIQAEWVSKIKEIVTNPNHNTYLIGHSLGVVTILRYLESLSLDQKIGGTVLVAGFPTSINIKEIENFTDTLLDYDTIKSKTDNIIAIHSDNDPYVPIEQGQIFKERLSAELIVIPGGKHFNEEDGCTKLPIVLEKLLEISK